jgi:hypothetical protein
VPDIIDRVNREHPYEVPCVIAVPIIAGNPAYIQWIRDETTVPVARTAYVESHQMLDESVPPVA